MNRAWFVTMAIRVAALAVASLFVSGAQPVPARAASVGGECCADLEERVTELEAMAVTKGNRGISLQISGHVNKMIMYWNDGINDDVYIVDNKELETRFRLKGNANIAPEWSVGFMIEIGVVSADSSAVDVRTDGVPNENTDGILRNRLANFYIQSDQLGRITVGRGSPATDNIVLLNIAKTPIADSDIDWANDFHLVRLRGTAGCNGAGCRSTLNMDNISPSQDTRRANVVRYDTPSLFGLVFSTAWGEDDIADIAIRYKKEWNSIRFVGGVGYLWATDEREGAATRVIACPSGLDQAACADERFDLERILGSVSAMYVPSGIFVYAAAAHDDFGVSNNQSHLNRSSFVAPITGQQPEDATMWYVPSSDLSVVSSRPILGPPPSIASIRLGTILALGEPPRRLALARTPKSPIPQRICGVSVWCKKSIPSR